MGNLKSGIRNLPYTPARSGHISRLEIGSQGTELAIHFHEVEFVPGLNYLAVADADDGHTREFYRAFGRRNPEAVAKMRARHAAAGGYHVTLDDRILDNYPQVGICLNKLTVQLLKTLGPADLVSFRIGQPVCNSGLGQTSRRPPIRSEHSIPRQTSDG